MHIHQNSNVALIVQFFLTTLVLLQYLLTSPRAYAELHCWLLALALIDTLCEWAIQDFECLTVFLLTTVYCPQSTVLTGNAHVEGTLIRAVWHLPWADHTSTAQWHDDLAAMVCCYGAYLCTSARADNWLEREHDVTSCTCKVRAFTDSKIVAIYSSEIWFDCHTNAVAFIGC